MTTPEARAAARAGLTLLITQSAAFTLATRAGLPTGLALLTAAITAAVTLTLLFRPLLNDLLTARAFRLSRPDLTVITFIGALFSSRLIAAGLLFAFPSLREQPNTFATQGLDLIPLLIAGALLIPVTEEAVFRGALLRGHRQHLPAFQACVTTALAFAAAHQHPMSVVAIFPLALLLARATLTAGNLGPAITTHVLNNAVALGSAQFIAQHPTLSEQAFDLPQLSRAASVGLSVLLITAGAGVLAFTYRALTSRDAPPAQPSRAWFTRTYALLLLIGVFGVTSSLLR